jgi:hypothetical protein
LVTYFPLYKADGQLEDYCYIKMMLYHPFRKISDLLLRDLNPNNTDPANQLESFTEAWQLYQESHSYYENLPHDGLEPLDPAKEDDEFEERDVTNDEHDAPSWAPLAAQRPNYNGICIEDADDLGNRDINRFDWSSYIGIYPELSGNWWDQ